jgi:hypothetical protein
MQVYYTQRILSFSLPLTRKLNKTQQTRVKCHIMRGNYFLICYNIGIRVFNPSLCEQVLPIVAIRLGEIKNLPPYPHAYVGRDSSVGISDSLWARRSGDRIPVVAKYSAPVQRGPGGHQASYTVGTGSFPGVERPGRGVDHPFTSSAEVKERVQLYIYSPSRPPWPVLGCTLPLPLLYHKHTRHKR